MRCIAGVAMLGLASAGSGALAEDEAAAKAGISPPSIATSLPHNGDPDGRRARLAERGVVYGLAYTNDLLANVDGGLKRGIVDQGKLEATLAINLEQYLGFKDWSLFANGFYLHNTGRMRRDYVGGINTIAAIEAVPALRLSEVWLERKLLDDKVSLRFGQLAADTEFFFSATSALFLQSDWATIVAANMPSGGPAYPLSTPGVRVKLQPTPDTTFLLAVFNGDPAGPGDGDEQRRNRHGLNFRVSDPPLWIGEFQHRANQGKTDTGLARTVKLGAWAHSGLFDDQRFAIDGSLLADPGGIGVALRRRGNSGLYGVIDQQLYRPPGGDAESGISMFARVSASPSDRNLVDFFVDGGVVFAGMVPGRPDDKFGASLMYTRFSDGARAFHRDLIELTGASLAVPDFEANLEITYSAEILPGFTLQPVATRVWHPSGDASLNATIVGVRAFIKY